VISLERRMKNEKGIGAGEEISSMGENPLCNVGGFRHEISMALDSGVKCKTTKKRGPSD